MGVAQITGSGHSVDCIVADIYGEATSEKMAMGHALDTASAWSPARTATCRRRAHILRGGTAYITDIGMCGDYDSVPGWSRPRATRLCAVYLETDEATGVAREVAPLRIGGRLAPQWST